MSVHTVHLLRHHTDIKQKLHTPC